MVKVFSYGTLQYKQVQCGLFGRELEGFKDSLAGYRLSQIQNSNPGTIDLSGETVHLLAVYSGNPAEKVDGMVLELTEEELKEADAYELPDYKRILVRLSSGQEAWLYVGIEAVPA